MIEIRGERPPQNTGAPHTNTSPPPLPPISLRHLDHITHYSRKDATQSQGVSVGLSLRNQFWGSGPIGDNDRWYHHIQETYLSLSPPLYAGSKPFLAGSEPVPARSEVLPALKPFLSPLKPSSSPMELMPYHYQIIINSITMKLVRQSEPLIM